MAVCRANHTAILLEPVLRLVWPPQIQGDVARGGGAGELGRRICGILLRGAGEPLAARPIRWRSSRPSKK